MTIIKKISELFGSKTIASEQQKQRVHITSEDEQANSIMDKAEAVYGQEKLSQQLFYEKWSTRDEWLLKDEAIPLVLGLDPEQTEWKNDADLKTRIDELFNHAVHCIEQGLSLNAVDKTLNNQEWSVQPAEFYCWASVSRVEVPEQLASLMEFIISTVKKTGFVTDSDSVPVSSPEAEALSSDFFIMREKMLGAALRLLISKPEDCQNSKGRVNARTLADAVIRHQDEFLEEGEESFALTTLEDLFGSVLTAK